ncbi:hypothetical protein SDC9_62886 [bioreactor metagenome]|uniref:DUF2800 domain-containing protein n=1 Tax=bioreactor metagenome TaxID=1076179 RepID=A0A644XK06_9ZZZZ
MAHAMLSASGASRWMACTPSARLEQQFENKTSDYAAEGTLAHELGELKLRKELEGLSTRSFNSKVKKIQEDKLYTADMPDYVDMYVETCLERVSEAKATTPDALFKIEQRLDFSEWVPEGFGTGDFVIIADGTMEVCDLKYGKGVPVSANNNKQMMLYALGAISEFSFLYDIEKVRMTIIQPRLDNISTFEVTVEDLLKWAEEYVKPKAELAIKGEGEFCAGDHCKFCRAKAVCRARAEKNLELAKYEFEKPPIMDNNDIAYVLSKVDELVSWASDVKEYALEEALKGEEFEGYKVVEGRSNRKWSSEDGVAKVLIGQGFLENIIYTKKLTGITNMESAIGKKEVQRLLGDYIIKPVGKPTLVPVADKREPYNPAKSDFLE